MMPQFPGPTTDGRAVCGDLPLKWSEKENIRWKTRIHAGHPARHGGVERAAGGTSAL